MSSRLDQYRNDVFGRDSNITANNDLQDYLRSQRKTRASLSRKDLQNHTDVKCFVSPNFANLASLIVVISLYFSLGFMGWGRDIKGTYEQISFKYEGLLTPAYWVVVSSWITIFLSEAIFIMYSFFNSYSHLSIIQEGVSFFFFFVNCFQIGWIISYCFEVIWLAFLFMAVNVICLIWLNFNLYYQDSINKTPRLNLNNSEPTLPQDRPTPQGPELERMNLFYEWLVFRLPFQIHLGWCLFVLIVNFNDMAIAQNWETGSGIIGLCSVIAMWLIGIYVLFYPKYPAFMIPLTISWACMGVWINLGDPSQQLKATYETKVLARMHGAIVATCIEHLLIAMIRFIFKFLSAYQILEREEN